MSVPTTRSEFLEQCLRTLGKPVIQINIAEEQAQDCVDDALSLYHEFHYDAVERVYLKHELTDAECANGYIDIPDPIRAVTKIFPIGGISTGILNSANPLSPAYQLRLNDLFNGTYSFISTSLIDYYMYQRHMTLIDQLLAGETPIRFNKHTNRLYIDGDFQTKLHAGVWLIIECKRILDPDTYSDVWTDDWLRRYCTALLKQRWGNNMKRYSGMKLPGGTILDGQRFYDEATEEIGLLRQELRDVWEEPPMMEIG
jgi:hypothetical protein